ncbi:MAG: carboxypeptidase regulatory-like domain-containing protein, partial [Agriterribacter sp.]
MSTKQVLPLLLYFFVPVLLNAQTGLLKGTITTADGEAAQNITVVLEESKHSAISNAKGYYEIKNIKPGRWTLTVSAVGTETQKREITITGNETITEDFVIAETATQL